LKVTWLNLKVTWLNLKVNWLVSSQRAFSKNLDAEKLIKHEPTNGLRLREKAEPEPRGLSINEICGRTPRKTAIQN